MRLVKRSLEFKIRVIQLHWVEEKTAIASLQIACDEFGTSMSPSMSNHPNSYIRDYLRSLSRTHGIHDEIILAGINFNRMVY